VLDNLIVLLQEAFLQHYHAMMALEPSYRGLSLLDWAGYLLTARADLQQAAMAWAAAHG
jgi:hypothetical protein